MKWKVWLGKDTPYNHPYYKIIGEIDEVPTNKNVFPMVWVRWVPVDCFKRDIKLTPHSTVKWVKEKQETLFYITNRNSQGIYIVEVFDDNSKQTFKL